MLLNYIQFKAIFHKTITLMEKVMAEFKVNMHGDKNTSSHLLWHVSLELNSRPKQACCVIRRLNITSVMWHYFCL
jgi:hypothetical protein